MMAPIKFAAAAGLVGGIWIPYLAAVTCAALILYFVIAISMHIAARDSDATWSSMPLRCS